MRESEKLMQENLEWQRSHGGVNLELMNRIEKAIQRELPELRRERKAEEEAEAQELLKWFGWDKNYKQGETS